MSDPITLIAFGAAVGGTAGKFAEKAWDNAERWLKERFGSHAAESQAQARLNAADFVRELAAKLPTLEAERGIGSLGLDKAIGHPQFSSLLQRTLLNSAESDDSAKHDLLASLVAARLLVESDITLALASSLGSDAIAHSTSRQIRLTALCSFADEVRPRVMRTIEEYRVWLQACLSPFEDFEFREIDARHLMAIACASYDPTSGRSLQAWLAMKLSPELSSSFLRTNIEELELQAVAL